MAPFHPMNDRENGMVEVTAGLVRKILADILPVSG
jgi:hypothetical protein